MKTGPCTEPSDVATDILPVVAPAGATTSREVLLALFTVAVMPLNLTVLSNAVVLKLLPDMVTSVPALPDEGLIELTAGASGCGEEFFLQPIMRIRKEKNTAIRFIKSQFYVKPNTLTELYI